MESTIIQTLGVIYSAPEAMDKGMRIKPQPFEAFNTVYTVLKVAGFAKIVTKNRYAKICHEIYRPLAVFIVFIYTAQHFIFTVQVRNEPLKFIEGAVLMIPEVAFCAKSVVMYLGAKQLDKLNNLIKDPIFGANTKQDEEYIKENTKSMNRLSKLTVCSLCCVAAFWIAAPIINRMNDETVVVPSYMPFSTHTWRRFLLSVFLDSSPILWVGFGHFNIDCLIATYYSQAQMQLKIIRYNLEHLIDSDKVKGYGTNNKNFIFVDVLDKSVHEKFVHLVKRYEKVVWFTYELNAVFGQAISFQFFLTSLSSCLVVYQMSITELATVQFAFLVGYYLLAQYQIIVYCHYGGLVEYESKFVANSLYCGEWLSLSPRFRRQLLIAMARWTVPIVPRVSGIVPLSLTTFIAINRSAYTLFTVLKNKNNRVDGQRSLAF